jgi:RNA polymerase sigma-70 factor (ECF subfamily)
VRDAAEDDLDACMARLADGDRAAFDPLFRALHPRALRLASARLGRDRAADAAQSALVKVFARAAEFERGRPVLPWFYAIVANEVRAAARGERRDEPAEILETLAAEGDPESLLVRRELARALDLAVLQLDAPSANAIAALLGTSARADIAPDAFRKRVSRAYQRLRVLLGGFR